MRRRSERVGRHATDTARAYTAVPTCLKARAPSLAPPLALPASGVNGYARYRTPRGSVPTPDATPAAPTPPKEVKEVKLADLKAKTPTELLAFAEQNAASKAPARCANRS